MPLRPPLARSALARSALARAALLLGLAALPLAGATASPVRVDETAFATGAVAHPFPDSGAAVLAGFTFASPNAPLAFGDATAWGTGPGGAAVPYATLVFSGLSLVPDAALPGIGFRFGSNVAIAMAVRITAGDGSVLDAVLEVTGDDQPADGIGNWVFWGFTDPSGIAAVEIEPAANGFFAGLGELVSLPRSLPVPEPGALALLGAGLAGLALARRARART